MLQKINLKIASLIFLALLILVIITEIGGSKKGERSFKSELINFNNAEVTRILLHPRSQNGKSLTLNKENDVWMVTDGEKSYKADQNNVTSMLNSINKLTAESLISSSKEKWSTYEVNDSLGSKVKVFSDKKILADLIVGKIKFAQPQKISTYIRLADEKQTYSVNGFLSMTFNRDMNQLRDKTILNAKINDLVKLEFNYPADSSFTLSNRNDQWYLNNTPADSAAVAQYLQNIHSIDSYQLNSNKPDGNHTPIQLNLEQKSGDRIQIKLFVDENDESNSFLTSSLNTDAYFKDQNAADKIFKSSTHFEIKKSE